MSIKQKHFIVSAALFLSGIGVCAQTAPDTPENTREALARETPPPPKKSKYIGKTLLFWAKDCGLPLKEFCPEAFSPWGPDRELHEKIESILFIVYQYGWRYNIYILFDAPYTLNWSDAMELEGDEVENWGPKFYDFYKDAIIKDIKIYRDVGDPLLIEEYDLP